MATETKTIALIGNVGVGKSTVFERLIRGRANKRQVNGTCVEITEAPLSTEHFGKKNHTSEIASCEKLINAGSGSYEKSCIPSVLVDAPGTAILFGPGADEDAIAYLLLYGEVDTLLFVADAKNLRRSLVSFLQAAEFGLPMVFVLNMTDEARDRGLEFDLQSLSRALRTEVVKIVAIENESSSQIRSIVRNGAIPQVGFCYPSAIEKAIEKLQKLLSSCNISARALSLMLLSGNSAAKHFLETRYEPDIICAAKETINETQEVFGIPLDVVISNEANRKAERLTQSVVLKTKNEETRLDRLNRWMSHPLYGLPIASAVLFIGYLWVGVLGATVAVDYIDQGLFRSLLLPIIGDLLGMVPLGIVNDVIIDPDFGLLPSAVFLAAGVVFPILFFFYVFFGFLEDSGYLPRLSVLMDRGLRLLGLDGRGVFPLIFGLSCVTSALLTTRILKSRKQRIIASFLLLLSYPCAPLLSVMLVVLAPLPWSAAALLFGLLTVQTIVAGVVANRVMTGTMPDFIMELPPLRVPQPKAVVTRSLRQSVAFLKEALPIFLLASIVLFAMDRLGALTALENTSRPIVKGLLGLPDQAVQILIKTIVRRESGAAELAVVQEQFTGVQLVITMFVMTVLVPCVNTTIVLFKELGVRLSVLFLAVVTIYAVTVGSALNHVCQFFNISFG